MLTRSPIGRIARRGLRLVVAATFALPCIAGVGAAPPPAKADAAAASILSPSTFGKGVDRAVVEKLTGHYGYRLGHAQVADMPQTAPRGGNFAAYMSMTGGRPDIGLNTGDAAKMIASNFDPTAVASVRASVERLHEWPVHFTVAATGKGPVKPWEHLKETLDEGLSPALRGDTTAEAANAVEKAKGAGGRELAPDSAHQFHPWFALGLYAWYSGDRALFDRCLYEGKSWVAYNFIRAPVASRFGRMGVIHPEASTYNPRGAAWSLVTLVQTYVLLHFVPDDEWFEPVKYMVESNIVFLDGSYHTGTFDTSSAKGTGYDRGRTMVNAFGLMQNSGRDGPKPGTPAVGSGFMAAFQSEAVLWVASIGDLIRLDDRSRSTLKSLATWAARWPIGLAGDPNDPNAFPYQRFGLGTAVAIGMWKPDGTIEYPATFGDLYRLNLKYGKQYGLTFTKPVDPKDDRLDYGDEPLGDIGASYVAMAIPMLTFAQGQPGWQAAWDRVTGSSTWRSFKQTIAYEDALLPPGMYVDDGTKHAAADVAAERPRVAAATPPRPHAAEPASSPAPAAAAAPAGPAAPPPAAVPDASPGQPSLPPAPVYVADPSAVAHERSAPTATHGADADRAWGIPAGSAGPLPFRNTLRSVFADTPYRGMESILTTTWPGAVWIPDRDEVAQATGGHADRKSTFIAYANLKTMRYELRNLSEKLVHENEPDPPANPYIGHAYNGLALRPAAWGYGPDLILMFSWNGGGQRNPVTAYDPAPLIGGGRFFLDDAQAKALAGITAYGIVVRSDALKGFFVADSGAPEGPTAFVSGDGKVDRRSYPQLIEQYANGVLALVADEGILVGINRTASGLRCRLYDLRTKQSAALVPIVAPGFTVADFDPNRAGLAWLPGKGIVGLRGERDHAVQAVRLRLGKRPLIDPPTIEGIAIGGAPLPRLQSGVWGSLVPLPERGVSFLNTGPDTPPLVIHWPDL